MINQILKIGSIFAFIYFCYATFNSLQAHKTLNQKQETRISNEQKSIKLEQEKFKKIQTDFQERLAFIQTNKIETETQKTKIQESLTEIDSSGYFQSKIVSIRNSKKFLNVAVAELSITSKFNNFDLVDFEALIREEMNKIGMALPFQYTTPKQAKIYLVMIKKNDGGNQ